MADFEADFNLEEQPEIEAVFSIEVEVKKHNDLIDRDAENCHPMGAITGLTEAIESKQDVITDLNEIREGAALGATAVQSVESGTENGTISVDGTDVSVTGLGSAAFTASTDYDVAGAASTAEQNAKNYADSLASNYATAEQGQKADTAVQTIETGTTDGTISVDGTEVAVAGLGSAAYTSSTDYATSAQGTKADTAVQPSDLATVATSGLYSDLSGTPTIPTVNNPTITFTQGGVTKGSFTLNQSSAETIALDAGGGGGSGTEVIIRRL